jgi:chromosome segregation ATPase
VKELKLTINSQKNTILSSKKDKEASRKQFAEQIDKMKQSFAFEMKKLNESLSAKAESEKLRVLRDLKEKFEAEKSELVASLSAQHSKSIGEIKLELANARSNFDISEAKVLELRNKLKDQMAEYSAKSEDFNKKHKDAVKVKKHIKKLFISFFLSSQSLP